MQTSPKSSPPSSPLLQRGDAETRPFDGEGSSISSGSSSYSDTDDPQEYSRLSRVGSVDGAYERYLNSKYGTERGATSSSATASTATAFRGHWARQNRRLMPSSPARKLPATSLDTFERKQLQRRLLEVTGLRSRPLLETFNLDTAARQARVAAGPDRGKLLHHRSVKDGLSLNSTTGVPLGARASRLVSRLPPLLAEKPQRTMMVTRTESTSSAEALPHVPIPHWMLRELGMLPSSGGDVMSSVAHHHSRHAHPTSDDPLPTPSDGLVEAYGHHHHRSRSIRALSRVVDVHQDSDKASLSPHVAGGDSGIAHALPHIPLSQLPPRLNLPSVQPTRTLCTPPGHLRRDALEQRLTLRAEEREELLLCALESVHEAVLSVEELADPFGFGSENKAGSQVAEAVAEVEATPKPEGVDDRTWGCTIRDPQAEAAARLRQRMEAQQPVPSNTPICFGAVDHLVQLCAPEEDRLDAGFDMSKTKVALDNNVVSDEFTASFAASLGARRKSTMHIPLPVIDVRDDALLVLAVGVNTAAVDETTLPYDDAEINAEWLATIMSHAGARCALLRGYEATAERIREAIGALVAHARVAVSQKRTPKLFFYFSGKGRLTPSGDMLFCPHDSAMQLNHPFESLNLSNFINLHELASRFVDFSSPNGNGRLSPRRTGSPTSRGSIDEFRWNFPIVVYDVLYDRMKRGDDAAPLLPSLAHKKDFWRPTYFGGILALQHDGGTLSLSCSSRHRSLVVYYLCKASEGKLTNRAQHVGSISQITQYVAEKLRRRVIPTMELRCTPLPADFVPRSAEEIFHPSKTLYATAAAKREAKKARERKQCRWTMYLEVGLEYRYNPALYVSNLVRIKELLFLKTRHTPKNAPPLMLWMGSRRMEHRFYLPLNHDPSSDVLRFDLMSCITRSNLHKQGSTGQYYVAASLESIEHSRFDFSKGEHCVIAHSQGVNHNRWSYNPFVAGMYSNETMGGLRSHSDADLDFVYVLAECSAKVQEMEVLSFLDGKHCSELITVHGSGSINDLRRLMKFARLGQFDIDFCRNTRLLRVEVTSLGENEVEEAAALVVQKFIRRYLTTRVMKSRLAAARSLYKTHFQAWVDIFDSFQEDVMKWFVDFQEGSFAALEASQSRIRREVIMEERELRSDLHDARCLEWVELEHLCRYVTSIDALKEHWLLRRLGEILPEYAAVSSVCRCLSNEEHALRHESMKRQSTVCEEFAERRTIRKTHEREWALVLAACAPVRLGKRVKRSKSRYDLPLDSLMLL